MQNTKLNSLHSNSFFDMTASTTAFSALDSARGSLCPQATQFTSPKVIKFVRPLKLKRPTPETTKILLKLNNSKILKKRSFTMFRDKDLLFGKSKMALEIVESTMDDDVQSETETITKAKSKLDSNLLESIKEFSFAVRKDSRKKLVQNWLS